MNLFKKIFSFSKEDNSAIGLCQFNDEYFKLAQSREKIKKRIKKDDTLCAILRKAI